MNVSIRRNNGIFEAESRLWYVIFYFLLRYEGIKSVVWCYYRACYIAIPLYICGFVTLGAALEKHLSPGALIMGWGIAELAVMINTVAIYAYCNDCFPKQQAS